MGKSPQTCPNCHTIVCWKDNVFRPFCSEHCQLVDLQGWFGERYRIAQDEESDPDDTENLTEHDRDAFPR